MPIACTRRGERDVFGARRLLQRLREENLVVMEGAVRAAHEPESHIFYFSWRMC